MKTELRVGIVGCGAIGNSLAKIINKDFSRTIRISALYDLEPVKSRKLSEKICDSRRLAVRDLTRLTQKSELVIECAAAQAAFSIAKAALSEGCDIIVMSVGGILDKISQLRALAKKHNARIYIPSGALCGMDALKALEPAQIKKVVLTTVKNPGAFRGVSYVQEKFKQLDRIKKDTVVFYGSAKKAVKLFPQNINVAATLSIAGLGAEKTMVKIIASPSAVKNTHQITIESVPANIIARTENITHPDNPKTSYLAVLSAVAVLRQLVEPVKIGS